MLEQQQQLRQCHKIFFDCQNFIIRLENKSENTCFIIIFLAKYDFIWLRYIIFKSDKTFVAGTIQGEVTIVNHKYE